MSQWINIDRLGTKGTEPDLMAAHREPQSLDYAINVRAVGSNLANAGGYGLVLDHAIYSTVNTFFLGKNVNLRLLILCSQEEIYTWDGTTIDTITGDPVDDGVDARWSGGFLTGALTLANSQVVRTFKPGVDATSVPMQYDPATGDTWEAKGYSAAVFRPFRNYMMAGNVNWGGAQYPTRVQWCDAVQPGQVPNDWVPTDTNRAGDVDLADTPGAIVDMHPLRDSLIIYKRDSIYSCQWVGGNQVFAFERLTTNQGIIGRDCVVEYEGRHWCQGDEDIFVVDGNSVHSLLYGRIKNEWLNDRCGKRPQNSFTALDLVNEEILFCYTQKGTSQSVIYPNRVLVLDLRNNAFFFRDYEMEMPYAKLTLDLVDQDTANFVFHGIDRTGSRILDLESTPDRLGATVPAELYRTQLFADPGHEWVQIDEAKLNMSGNKATLNLGDQIAIDAPITWRGDFAIDPLTDYKTDARANGNLIAYRIRVDTEKKWQISNLMLKAQKSGERG